MKKDKTVKSYTRKIDRTYNKILLDWSTSTTDESGNMSFDINPHNAQLANDYLVRSLFWLKEKDIDEMDMQEYSELLKMCKEKKDFLSNPA